MHGGDKDIDHLNSLADDGSDEERREYEEYFDTRDADEPKESEVYDR